MRFVLNKLFSVLFYSIVFFIDSVISLNFNELTKTPHVYFSVQLRTTAESSKESSMVDGDAVCYLLFHTKYAAHVPFFNK
jgi:hypothetical protein